MLQAHSFAPERHTVIGGGGGRGGRGLRIGVGLAPNCGDEMFWDRMGNYVDVACAKHLGYTETEGREGTHFVSFLSPERI